MSKVILSVLFFIFILGTLVSLSILASAEMDSGVKDNALLICDSEGSGDTMTVKKLSPFGLQAANDCNIDDDCALCLDVLSDSPGFFQLIEMRRFGGRGDPAKWLWGFWLRADAR